MKVLGLLFLGFLFSLEIRILAQPQVRETRSLPTVVYVRDANCPFCKRFEADTLSNLKVIKELTPYGKLKVLDEFKDAVEARRLGYKSTPTIILVNQDGTILRSHNGYLSPLDFLDWLNGIRRLP